MKKCACCKLEKERTDFHKKYSNKDGLYAYCKECKAKKDSEYYNLNRDKVLEYAKDYASKNKPKLKEYLRQYGIDNKESITEYNRQFRETNKSKVMYRAAKNRAKRQDLDFDINITDVVVPDFCPILKIPLDISKAVSSRNSPSLDRIDPGKGYIKGNVQVISLKANVMKSNASKTDLLLFAEWILDNYLEDDNE